jgi:thiosulfate dehydrogenase
VLLSDPPTVTHPAYPETGAKTAADTWRCVECHGWDYRGVEGAYGEGPHYTGVRGLRGMIGAPPGEIATIVRDDTHRYTAEMIPDGALWLLALFVSRGQHDTTQHIDEVSGAMRGDAERGRAVFQNVCAVCHDFDGMADTSDEGDGIRSLSAVAVKNPWRALHKAQNGQPGSDMPAMRVLGIQTVLDVLAYAQTLGQD